MTCYETLRSSAPAAEDAPMAHHFVKWWRNKFRKGYKKFSIGSESERTDTEELVGRAASQCSAPPDLLPSEARSLLQPPTPTQRRTTRPPPEPTYLAPPSPVPNTQPSEEDRQPRLRFEELTCDVELQHPQPSKQHPLQFSFTLYDLDGHGRMTKDDIAGIVSTIYESIGKSVTVPHYGSKTIQVKLTVVPDDGSGRNERERREVRRRRRKENMQPAKDIPQECDEHSDEDHRLSPDDDASSKSSCSAERRHKSGRHHNNQNSRSQRHHQRDKRERKHTKKRSGSLQRRELLEIIQANMEKNHLSFQTSRKPCPEYPVNEEEIKAKYQKLRNRAYTVSDKPFPAPQKAKADVNRHGYLDLACNGDSNLCRYDRYLHAVICSSARHAHTGYHQKQQTPVQKPQRNHSHHHPRSRSHDLPLKQPQQPRVLQIIFL